MAISGARVLSDGTKCRCHAKTKKSIEIHEKLSQQIFQINYLLFAHRLRQINLYLTNRFVKWKIESFSSIDGHSDLRALAASLPPAKRDEILDVIRGTEAAEGDIGPTKTLLSNQEFDEVYLLSNYKKTWNKWFQKWLKLPTNMIEVELEKPTDYDRIFKIADEQLSLLKASSNSKTTELCLHLSPGTPAMAAVWLLLGKTRFPATFYETHQGKWWITNVPFDLVDVIPDVLNDPDNFLQSLTSESPQKVEGFEDIIGESKAIREAVGRSKRVAMHGVSVLLLGKGNGQRNVCSGNT